MSEEWENSIHKEEEEHVETVEQKNEEEPVAVEEEEEQIEDTSSIEQTKQWKSSFHRKEEKVEEEKVEVYTTEKLEPIVLTENDKQAFKQAIENLGGTEEEERSVPSEQPKQWKSSIYRKEEKVEEEKVEVSATEKLEPIVLTENDKQAFKKSLEGLVDDEQKEEHPFYKHTEIQPIEPEAAVVPAPEVEPEAAVNPTPKVEPEAAVVPAPEVEPEAEVEKRSWKNSIFRKEEKPAEKVKTIEQEKPVTISKTEPKMEEEKDWRSSIYRKKQEPSDDPSQPSTQPPKKKKFPIKWKRERTVKEKPTPTRELSDTIKQKKFIITRIHRITSWSLIAITIITVMLGYTITNSWAWDLSTVTKVHMVFEWIFIVLFMYHFLYTLIFVKLSTIKVVKNWKKQWVRLVQKTTKWLIFVFVILTIFSGFNRYAWAGNFFESWLPFRLHRFFDSFLVVTIILHTMAGAKIFFNRQKIKHWAINIPIVFIGVALITGAMILI